MNEMILAAVGLQLGGFFVGLCGPGTLSVRIQQHQLVDSTFISFVDF